MPPIDDLPGELILPTRQEIHDRWIRDYALRNPGTDTGQGTQPDIDAWTFADQASPLYANARTAALASDPTQVSGKELDTRAGADGVERLPAQGASGFVQIEASAGGGLIQAGDECVYQGLRFAALATAIYQDGAQVAVQAVDAGPATNLRPDTVLAWASPRPGVGPRATVVDASDGEGLTGGRAAETEDEYRERWLATKRRRPASGNDVEIQDAIEKTPGVPVERAFTYPAIRGPGTTGFVFTLRSGGASRVPNAAQVATVLSRIETVFPADDQFFGATLQSERVNVALRVAWAPGARGWADVAPWPTYHAGAGAIVVTAATDALRFTLDGNRSVAPRAGQTIAFFDRSRRAFVRKRLATVTGAGPWAIVCDTAHGASDASYAPVVGQRACPWSDSLESLAEPIASYMRSLGPGEQVATFFDPGRRQRRSPASPREWPSEISTRIVIPVLALPAVFNATLLEPTLPHTTPVGLPGTLSYLLELGDFAAFPL